jgi:hypothetical protein
MLCRHIQEKIIRQYFARERLCHGGKRLPNSVFPGIWRGKLGKMRLNMSNPSDSEKLFLSILGEMASALLLKGETIGVVLHPDSRKELEPFLDMKSTGSMMLLGSGNSISGFPDLKRNYEMGYGYSVKKK